MASKSNREMLEAAGYTGHYLDGMSQTEGCTCEHCRYDRSPRGIAAEAWNQIWDECCGAFEEAGGIGHDLGGAGLQAILRAWERIREPFTLEVLHGR